MVCAFHGNKPVRVRPQHLILNSDETTDYICKGLQPDNDTDVGLVSTASFQSSGTSSIYHHEDSNKMNGMRVKRHLITNALGDVAPLCYCFSGLTEREMPQDDFIIWEVEGLCVGGQGINGSRSKGYIVFLRNKPGMMKWWFRWIRINVLFPFIDKCREVYGRGEDQTAVSWFDGDTSQVADTVAEEGIASYAANNVIACKHNSSRTGVEQSLDKGKVFPVSKRLNKMTTLVHVPAANHALKRVMIAKFDEAKREVSMCIHTAAMIDCCI